MSDGIVLALSFGKPRSLLSNWRITEQLERILAKPNSVVVCDACLFCNLHTESNDKQVILIGSDDPNVHCSTWILVGYFADLVIKNKWEKISIVSEPFYSKRVKRDLEMAILWKNYKVNVEIETEKLCDNGDFFCPESSQPWTRHQISFYFRERVLMLMPFWLYKFLTGRS